MIQERRAIDAQGIRSGAQAGRVRARRYVVQRKQRNHDMHAVV